jgi:hypothetical protein
MKGAFVGVMNEQFDWIEMHRINNVKIETVRLWTVTVCRHIGTLVQTVQYNLALGI